MMRRALYSLPLLLALIGLTGANAESKRPSLETLALSQPRPSAPLPSRAEVRLYADQQVFSKPFFTHWTSKRVRKQRPLTRTPTVLPVLARVTDKRGRKWLRVMLPGRPNGALGWISPGRKGERVSNYTIRVQRGKKRLTLFYKARKLRTFLVVVGKRSTPTPLGQFFVEENIRLRKGLVGAPHALALSARSRVLTQFAGGDGQIGIHGLGGIGGKVGSAASHGCVRMSNSSIIWLAARVGPGVRVTVVA